MSRRINRDILRLSIPAIVSNITVPLLGLCDTGISGHLGSEVYMAAISVGAMMLNVLVCLLVFLRMGTTGLTATVFGAGDESGIRRIYTRALVLGLGIGVLLVILSNPIMRGMLALIAPDSEVTGYTERYFIIRIWGMPALLAVMAISGWFVGMQSTVYPMAISILMNVVNILLSFVLVFHTGTGFDGIAWGTTISNWVGLLLALSCAMYFRKGKALLCSPKEIFELKGIKKFFTVNVNLFLRSGFIMMVSLGVTAAGARLGSMALAVNVVVMQFFHFFSYFMDGFAFSGEALTGRYNGSGQIDMLKKNVSALLGWTMVVAFIFTLLYGIGNSFVTDLLTDNAGVREGVGELWIWITLLPLVSAWAFIYDGFYVGVTQTGKMTLATFIASVAYFSLAFLHIDAGGISISVSDNGWIWTGFLAYLLLRGVMLAVMWPATVKRMSAP